MASGGHVAAQSGLPVLAVSEKVRDVTASELYPALAAQFATDSFGDEGLAQVRPLCAYA